MADTRPKDHIAEVTAALAWWREAGVDCLFEDEPQQWVVASGTEPESEATVDPANFPALKARSAAPSPSLSLSVIGGDRALWPGDLAAFQQWWQHEPSLDAGQLRGRVPPRGPIAAPLLVLVPAPEIDDGDRLLSGPQGRLLAAMLAAMGLPAEQVYFASALPRHMPMADWADLAAQGLGGVLRHHLALVQPRRVLAFGRHITTILATVTLDPATSQNASPQIVPNSLDIGHDGASVPLMVARDLGSLLERPIAKGGFWQHWLEWSAGSGEA